jgi:hypothetical protein
VQLHAKPNVPQRKLPSRKRAVARSDRLALAKRDEAGVDTAWPLHAAIARAQRRVIITFFLAAVYDSPFPDRVHSRDFLVVAAVLLGLAARSSRADIVIDDFETGEGHFTSTPSTSGSTTGETETSPGVGPSTADQDLTVGISGSASQRIFLDDDPAVDVGSTSPVQTWRLRHLSGGGSPGNNLSITTTPDGYVGYYLMTLTPNLQASIMIDDGAALERASYQPIPADGAWHLYQWSFLDANQWEGFAGTGPNGIIDATSVTIDSVFVVAIKDTSIPDQNATFNIDYVATNPNGPLTAIPEPSSALLMACGLGSLALRRRQVSPQI